MHIFRFRPRRSTPERSSYDSASGEVTISIINGQTTFQVERLERWSAGKQLSRRQAPLWLATLVGVLLWVYPTDVTAAAYSAGQIISLTNTARQNHGLPKLQTDDRLMQSAAGKAQDMLAQGYFAHTSPSGQTPWTWFTKFGYDFTEAGENLAMDFVEAADVVDAWLDSSTHQKNLLSSKFADIGVAVVEGELNGQATIVVVQFFGSQRAATPPPAPAPVPAPTPEPPLAPTPSPPTPVAPPAPIVTTQSAPTAPSAAPAASIPTRLPSLTQADGVPIPSLTFTLQDPDRDFLTPRLLVPRVEGLQSPVRASAVGLPPALQRDLPVLILIVFLVDFLAIVTYGLLRPRSAVQIPELSLGFATRPVTM